MTLEATGTLHVPGPQPRSSPRRGRAERETAGIREAARAEPALADMMQNRRWLWRDKPFPHVVATDVFIEPVCRELEQGFREVLERGVGPVGCLDRLSRNMGDYDACSLNLQPEAAAGPFGLFLSRPWHDMLARVLKINATGDVTGALHHHRVGSACGAPHNDLNPGWFANAPTTERLNVLDVTVNSYFNGDCYAPGVTARETVRAAAMLYYLNNTPWRRGDGGETALYASCESPAKPALAIPPINNSLLLFECTPHSYHGFLTNRANPRNSVIMWLHRPKEEAVERWGSSAVVKWA